MNLSFDVNDENDVQKLLSIDKSIDFDDEAFVSVLIFFANGFRVEGSASFSKPNKHLIEKKTAYKGKLIAKR